MPPRQTYFIRSIDCESTLSRPSSGTRPRRSGNAGEKVAIPLPERDQWLGTNGGRPLPFLLFFDYLKSDSQRDPLTNSVRFQGSAPLCRRVSFDRIGCERFVRNTSGQGSSFILRGSMNRIDFTALPLVPRRPRNALNGGGGSSEGEGLIAEMEGPKRSDRACTYKHTYVYIYIYIMYRERGKRKERFAR